MTMISTRSRKFVEENCDLRVVAILQPLHIYSTKLALQSVFASFVRSFKNLSVVSRPSQRRVPTIVDEQKRVSISVRMKREVPAVLRSVTHQIQTSSLYTVSMFEK